MYVVVGVGIFALLGGAFSRHVMGRKCGPGRAKNFENVMDRTEPGGPKKLNKVMGRARPDGAGPGREY